MVWWRSLIGLVLCISGQAAIASAYLLKRYVAQRRYQKRISIGIETNDATDDTDEETIDEGDGLREYEYKQQMWRQFQSTWRHFTHRLTSPLWWLAVVLLLGGETLNFVSYIFLPAFVVALLNGLNVLLSVLGAVMILKERVTWHIVVGAVLGVVGMAIVLILVAIDATATMTHFQQVVAQLGQPIPAVFLSICSLIVFSGVLSATITSLTVDSDFRRQVVYMVLFAYAASAAWSVLNTKSVGLMLTSPVKPSAYAVLVVPWWLLGVFGQLLLINWMFTERPVSWVSPLMYAMYATVAVWTSQFVFKEMDAFSAWWHMLLAALAYVLVVAGVAMVASRKD